MAGNFAVHDGSDDTRREVGEVHIPVYGALMLFLGSRHLLDTGSSLVGFSESPPDAKHYLAPISIKAIEISGS